MYKSNAMRLPIILALLSVVPSVASSQEIDADTMTAVVALATKGYAAPEAAEIRNVRKSLARNGMGYCGEVTIEDGEGFTVFHAIIESGTGPSVIRLADYPEGAAYADIAQRLMRNFGCVE